MSIKVCDICQRKCQNRPFLLEYLIYRVINWTEFYEYSFSDEPYYLAQTMLSYQCHVVATVSLFSAYYAFNKIPFDCLKAYHHISHESEMNR